MTPAEHRAEALANLRELRRLQPGAPDYSGRAQAAIASNLLAISAYLEDLIRAQAMTSTYLERLVAILEPPPAPDIPGLPLGWRLAVDQASDGDQLWAWTLTVPGRRAEATRHHYGSYGTALTAGLSHADLIAAEMGAGDYATRDQPGHAQAARDRRELS